MGRPALFGITLLASIVVASSLVPLALAEWPMDGADSAHTGVQLSPVTRPVSQWEYDAGAELLHPPSTAYSKLFLGTSDGTLVVLDETDGRETWTLRLGESISGTPLVESQTAFVPSDNVLYAVTITNRSIRWSFEAVGNLRSSPIIEDNVIYIGSDDKRVYAIDKYSGDLEWSLKLDDVVAVSPSISGNTLVVGTESGLLYGIHRTEGTEEWRTDLGSSVSTAACIDRDRAMVGTYGGHLHAVEVEDGDVVWTYPPAGEPPMDPVLTTPVTSSGLVYIGGNGLLCLEVGTGLEVWSYATGDFVRGSPAIVENYLVFGCYDGYIRCLHKTTGDEIWLFRTETAFRSSVSIDYDKAYIGGRDGLLYARSILNLHAPSVDGPNTLEAEAHDSIAFEVDAEDPEGCVLSYRWDFDDGNTSSDISPLHAYSEAGDYTVTVTVSDGSKSNTHTILVTVNPFEPVITGGDEDGLSTGVVVGAGAGVAVVVVVLLLLLLLMRRRRSEEASGEVGSEEATYPYQAVDVEVAASGDHFNEEPTGTHETEEEVFE